MTKNIRAYFRRDHAQDAVLHQYIAFLKMQLPVKQAPDSTQALSVLSAAPKADAAASP